MAENFYAPPKAEVADTDQPVRQNAFYVVSVKKLTILYFSTMGLYSLFWFYQNWRCYRDATQTRVWPIPRAIFCYFFIHSLFRKVLAHAGKQGITLNWKSGVDATLLVVMMLVGNFLDRLSFRDIGSPTTDLLSMLMLLPLFALFMRAQQYINTACRDNSGNSNARLTSANYIWIAIGLVIWSIGLFGIFAS